jgi:hypothetical protein
MIKVAQLISGPAGTDINEKDYLPGFDKEFYKKSLKRVGQVRVRKGLNGDDFVHNRISMVLEGWATKLPRFMNPIRGRRKGKLKSL